MKKTDFDIDIKKYSLLFFENLSEKDKRLYSGLEAIKIGYNGVSEVSEIYKINKHTIRKGKKELLNEDFVDVTKIRRKGGGRKKKLKL
jgi:predicted transcriptional regulator